MPEMCVNGRCTKEGKACLVCGGAVPPSLGCKPRIYCSAICCRRAVKGIHWRDKIAVGCHCCGDVIEYAGRGPRPKPGGKCKQCKKAHESARPKKSKQRTCGRCGESFGSPWRKQFCSRSCQYEGRGEIHGDTKPCERCGRPVKISCRNYRFCSRACAKDQKAYTCLNCGVGFTKKRYKSGSVSCQEKYCSRDCAFEARRLKKPCAVRPREIGGKLASWFLSWGDDYFPHVYKCCECGASLQQKKDSAKHEKCWSCRARKDRFCIDCGSPELASPSVKRCEPCREAAKAALKKRQRQQRKRRHGNSHTIRKRCRHHNAPYTPVSRKKIFDRDNLTCQLCGMRLLARYTRLPDGGVHGLSPTVDHIIPLARGPDGPGHVESNCQAACWGCNTEKGAADPDSFAAGKATDLDSKAWQKAQHQRRSTSSRCEDQRKPTTARSLAPL